MDTMQEFEGLREALRIVSGARVEVAGCTPVWVKLKHATDWIKAQMKPFLSEEVAAQ